MVTPLRPERRGLRLGLTSTLTVSTFHVKHWCGAVSPGIRRGIATGLRRVRSVVDMGRDSTGPPGHHHTTSALAATPSAADNTLRRPGAWRQLWRGRANEPPPTPALEALRRMVEGPASPHDFEAIVVAMTASERPNPGVPRRPELCQTREPQSSCALKVDRAGLSRPHSRCRRTPCSRPRWTGCIWASMYLRRQRGRCAWGRLREPRRGFRSDGSTNRIQSLRRATAGSCRVPCGETRHDDRAGADPRGPTHRPQQFPRARPRSARSRRVARRRAVAGTHPR